MLDLTIGARRSAIGRAALRWVLGVMLAALCAGASAAAARRLHFDRFSIEQGLSQETVATILQDRQGFMWFGTQAGLDRFDGYRITEFRTDPRDPGSISDNFVTASYEDADGRLWFGTKDGLNRFDQASGRFVRYRPDQDGANGGGDRAINAIVGDGHGGLWLATGDGLQHFDPASARFTVLRHDARDRDSLCDDRVNALALDNAGGVWVGTGNGLDRLDPAVRRFQHFRVKPATNTRRNAVLSLSMGPRETLWIGTGAGLEAWRLGEAAPQRRHIRADEGVGDVRIVTLYHDRGPTLWVGTDLDGLKWLDPASGRFISYRNQVLDYHSLSDNQVDSIWVDRTGTLWVGTLFGGVNRTDLASGGFSSMTPTLERATRIGNGKVRALVGDPDGSLWLGTSGAGLIRLDQRSGRTVQLRHDPRRSGSLPDDVVTALAYERGRLWVGTPIGLYWRDPVSGRFSQVALERDADANYIQSVRSDREGNLWIVTRGGLFALGPDGHTLRSWHNDRRDPSSLGENFCSSMLEDRGGAIWIGTQYGLDRLDPRTGKFTHFRHDPADPGSLRHSRIYTLFESKRGELWVGTAGGLHRVETAADGKLRFRFFPIASVRQAVPIGAVLEDAGGTLWVSSTLGISRLDPRTGDFKRYTAKDGLIDGSYFVRSAWADPGGELHFGGLRGMTSFMPGDIRDNPYAPQVAITDLMVANRHRALPQAASGMPAVTLSYRDSVFALEFAALHFADPKANRYAYQLEGFDPAWIETDASKRFVSYTNLNPGHYVFRVRASNKDGVWSRQPAALAITITPPFWMTWWFRALAAQAALGAVYAIYALRVRVLVQAKERLAHEVGARTVELRLQKEAAESGKREVERQKEVVEQAHRNISLLSDIGRKLTTNLQRETIMSTLHEHVLELMDAAVFAIVLSDPRRAMLVYPFAVIEGRRCKPLERSFALPDQLAAWCVDEGRVVFIDDIDLQCHDYLPRAQSACAARLALPCDDGVLSTPRSLLFVPIVAGTRVLGAITVQSFARAAYRQVHLDMLRTLAAYAGVALDNADAYCQLQETQARLAAHEKLASLGSLVAGVAHELNTPIGNSLLIASTLQEKTETMATRFEADSLRRSELAEWIAASREASTLIMRSLGNAAELVTSFRQVSVDQTSAQQRCFDLAQACHEITATMMNKVRRGGHVLVVDVPEGIEMDSFPGPLGQVLINFINNALLHAFSAPGGHMLLSATLPAPGRVRLTFSDDGRGIAPADLARVFDPFFTTRMGQGGAGLGLNIAYNIVTTLLGGSIDVKSEPGHGASFILDLPLKLARVARPATA
jgi:ligand-binding sensor domain-containing protein/signal transduction histidine kinase